MSSCLVVTHAEPEGPYALGEALLAAGVALDVRPVFVRSDLPDELSAYDGLLVMGGPMSATSERGFTSRAGELRLLAEALERGLPVLGICLGAQLLAAAAGGRVVAGDAGVEIGWAPVRLSAAAGEDQLLGGLPTSFEVLHWHGDTVLLPGSATHLASSERYANQAFRVGERAWGLQFHLEVDEDAVAAFLEAFGEEAAAAGLEPATIEAASPAALRQLAAPRQLVAERFAGLVLEEGRSRAANDPAG